MQPTSDGAKNCGRITIETVKERLRSYRRACRRCDELEVRIARKRSEIRSPKAVRTDSIPGGKGNSLEAAIEKIDALEHRLAAEQLRRGAALLDAQFLIDAVGSGNGKGAEDGKTILTMRYIDGVPFSQIGERLFLSDRSMWRHYNRAVRDIVKNLLLSEKIEE